MPGAALGLCCAAMKKEPSIDTKSGTRDEIEGATKTMTGKVKETTGKVLGNPRLEAQGDVDQILGQAQKKVGEIKRVLGQ
jgi:uncharacterized protein YjbJ (UPF0337 family)